MRRAATRSLPSPRYSCSDESGQASVEAALLLPAIMVCLALLVQPMCLLYTRSVMESAAAQACRLLATAPSGSESRVSCEAYVLHRLEAVPRADVFCTGDWQVELEGDADAGQVRVGIVGHARPLPLVGVVASMLGPLDATGAVELRVEVGRQSRPQWLEGDYGEWVQVWDA